MQTVAEIEADIAAVRAARIALAKGERVEETSREARRMKLASVSLDDLTTLLQVLEQDLRAAIAAEAGQTGGGRAAIGIYY